MLPGVLNATKYCARCNEGLATTSVEVGSRYISLLSPFDRTQGLVYLGNEGQSHLSSHLDPEAWVLPGVMNAMTNCACCNEGLATSSSEVGVRFISLLSPFDRTQGLGCEGKEGQSHLKRNLDQET